MPSDRRQSSCCAGRGMKGWKIGWLSRKTSRRMKSTVLMLLAAHPGNIWMAHGWTTTTSPTATIGRICPQYGRSSIFRIKMSNGVEGWGDSYEEQYASFAKQQQQQQQQQQQANDEKRNQSNHREREPKPISSTNWIDEDPIQITNMDMSDLAANEKDNGIHTDTSHDNNRKAEEDLEMAFLEFISGSFDQTMPVPPTGDQQLESRNPDQTLHADISTTLDFGMISEHWNANPAEDAEDDDIASELGSSTSDSTTSSPTNSIASNDLADNDITTTIPSKYASDPSSFSTEMIFASNSYQSDEDPVTDIDATVDATAKRSSLPASTSYLENLGGEGETSDRSSDTIIESKVKAPDSNSEVRSDSGTNPEENYYTIEVRVETTFPTGITVEDAKRGWLEFCWASGGGIVVPIAESAKPPSASKPNSKKAGNAPSTIRFESDNRACNDSENNNLEMSHESGGKDGMPPGIPMSRELIVPLGMKQELVSSTSTIDEVMADTIRHDVVTYKTTKLGFFCRDMIEDSHEGKVEFIGASYTSTRMIWTVMFQVEHVEERLSAGGAASTTNTKSTSTPTSTPKPTPKPTPNQDATANLKDFAWNTKIMVEDYSRQFMDSNLGFKTMLSKANVWGSWSQFQLKTASQNLIAYLDTSADSMPLLEHTETLPLGVSPREAMEVWYDYYWKNGGGTIPIMVSSKKGTDTRWFIPSGLEEELISLEYDHPVSESGVIGVDGEITTEIEIAKAVYRVNNPNLLTYPVHYNRATVRFERDNELAPTQLIWKVRLKPYRKFLGGGVLFWTKNGITFAARNLRSYLELRQLERRERELQVQLEMLRIENQDSNKSSATKNDAESDNQQPLDGFKTVRSTVSISSGQGALGVDYEKAPTKNEEHADDNNEDSSNYTKEKDDQQSLNQDRQSKPPSNSPGVVVDQNTVIMKPTSDNETKPRTMFIPPRIIDRATTPIERSTHTVDGK